MVVVILIFLIACISQEKISILNQLFFHSIYDTPYFSFRLNIKAEQQANTIYFLSKQLCSFAKYWKMTPCFLTYLIFFYTFHRELSSPYKFGAVFEQFVQGFQCRSLRKQVLYGKLLREEAFAFFAFFFSKFHESVVGNVVVYVVSRIRIQLEKADIHF